MTLEIHHESGKVTKLLNLIQWELRRNHPEYILYKSNRSHALSTQWEVVAYKDPIRSITIPDYPDWNGKLTLHYHEDESTRDDAAFWG